MTNVLDAVLAQYEKNTANFGEDRMSQEERMKKYFACILGDNESQGQRKVRILPTKDGSSPFKEVWYHEIQIDGKWTKLYDPGKNDNERSPLTEVYEELTATGKESDKELAKQYRSRKFYIVKVIDRDKEHEGVKFWRFKDNYKKDGVLDKIIPIWRAKGDITDPNTGRDLIIQLTLGDFRSEFQCSINRPANDSRKQHGRHYHDQCDDKRPNSSAVLCKCRFILYFFANQIHQLIVQREGIIQAAQRF